MREDVAREIFDIAAAHGEPGEIILYQGNRMDIEEEGAMIRHARDLYRKEKAVLERKLLELIQGFEKRHDVLLRHTRSDRSEEAYAYGKRIKPGTVYFGVEFTD